MEFNYQDSSAHGEGAPATEAAIPAGPQPVQLVDPAAPAQTTTAPEPLSPQALELLEANNHPLTQSEDTQMGQPAAMAEAPQATMPPEPQMQMAPMTTQPAPEAAGSIAERVGEIEAENAGLRAENEHLKQQLAAHEGRAVQLQQLAEQAGQLQQAAQALL